MTLAILFGGSSYEHEISIVSAITLKKVLKRTTLVFIFVDGEREFYLIDGEKMKSSTFSSGEYRKGKKLSLEKEGFFSAGGGLLGGKKKRVDFDVLLNLIHGRDGEDGKVAGLMEFFGIPFIGPRLEASVLSYSKLDTKLLAQALGIETLEYRLLLNIVGEPSIPVSSWVWGYNRFHSPQAIVEEGKRFKREPVNSPTTASPATWNQ